MGESAGGFFKGAVGIGVLAAGLGVGYYFGIYLPNRDQAQGAVVAECLKSVSEQYSKDWENACQEMKLGKNCKLPGLLAKSVDDRRHEGANECARFVQ